MTPAEHIAAAEELLTTAMDADHFELPSIDNSSLLAALVHIGIAIAVETGTPHTSAPSPAAPNAS